LDRFTSNQETKVIKGLILHMSSIHFTHFVIIFNLIIPEGCV